jgi:hypothetical protein
MLQMDSVVTDLIFKSDATLDQATLLTGLGGSEQVAKWKVLDPDMLDPRAEMEISPSMPFRRRGERRLMLMDETGAPLRGENPDPSVQVPLDLRPAKEALIGICERLPIRLGRLFMLGSWGDAVMIARSARDLRAIALLPWILDPQVDVDGKRRGSQLSQKEFEAKVMTYDKRLDELDDVDILASITDLAGVNLEQRGDLIIVDVLDAEGMWLPTNSLAMEDALAAWKRFSMIPGAPASKPRPAPAPANGVAATAAPAAAPAPVKVEPKGPPLTVSEIAGSVVLVFPAERFDLDVAAALGKRDWDSIVRSSDGLTGSQRDRLHRDGGGFIAPLEFLSEVFVEGKPLSKPQFEKDAQPLASGGKALAVHFPRFGPVSLFEIPGQGRFVTSLTEYSNEAAALVRTK